MKSHSNLTTLFYSSLLQMIYESTEYRAESSDARKRGAFWKDFKDFNTVNTLSW
jgi:hypothetical protein